MSVQPDWKLEQFRSHLPGAVNFVACLENAGLKKGFASALDIGCGTGALLNLLIQQRWIISGTGIDLSEESIVLAQREHSDKNLKFMAADLRETKDNWPEFDLVVSDSVFHLIDGNVSSIVRPMTSADGFLAFTMPYKCWQNSVLLGLRRLLRAIRNPVLDKLIVSLAKAVYPGWTKAALIDRLPYVYLIPHRLFDDSFDQALGAQGYRMISKQEFPSTSMLKLRHKLLVYQKVSGGAHE